MNPKTSEDQVARRDSVRRDMLRTSTAMGFVLFIVLVLALVIGLTGARATRNLQRAEQAEAESVDRLWHAYVAQARATRLTATAGRRQASLTVVSNAAAIRTDSALRAEAVASLALTDLIREGEFGSLPREGDQAEMDSVLKRYAYGDAQGTVFIRRLRDGGEDRVLPAPKLGPGLQQAVRSCAFSPDGNWLAVRYAGGALIVWDLRSKQPAIVAGTNATDLVIAGMSFTPDSKRVAFSDPDRDREISVYDLETLERVTTGIRVGARTFRFRPGTMQVALATDNKVDLYDYPNDTPVRTFPHPTRVYMMAWSPNGTQLAVSCEDGDVCLWDLERGGSRLLRGHSEPCIRIGFSPDGKLLFTGARDGTTRLWDATLGQVIVMAEDGVGHIFSPDGRRLGFWRLSTALGSWRVDRSDSYASLLCATADGALLSLDLSPDGRWCVATQTKGFRVWDVESDFHESFFPVPGITTARVAHDGKSFHICTTNGLEVWPLIAPTAPDETVRFGPARTLALPDGRGARNIAVSGDNRTAAVELNDLRFVVLDLQGERPPVFIADRWRAANAKSSASLTGAGRFAISPDGKWVATGYWIGEGDVPRIWDATTGQLVTTLDAKTSLVVFSADGKWLGLAGVGQFSIWSVGDWKRVNLINRDEVSYTHGAMAFTGDNKNLAFTRTRQQVQLREAFGTEKFLDFIAPVPQSVNSIRLALDGSVLATASARDVVQVWKLKTIRQHLAAINLDWNQPPRGKALTAAVPGGYWLTGNTALLLGIVGFSVVTVLSLLTLRRHRTAIERFFAAEAKTARRNRELEVAKVELMHSQKMQALGTLATGIAHDFNNLLSVIRMSGKLIGRETRGNPEIQEHVMDIEHAVLQGKNVVGSMLGYARSDEDTIGPTDLSAAVEDAVSLLSKEFLSGIALTLELDREAPRVAASLGHLEQILLNLIVNAAEAMQDQGRLRIAVHARASEPAKPYILRPTAAKEYVELSVIDSGPGIPPEIRDRLFEPFFTTKRSGSKAGTGLGLSLVYAVAQQNGMGLSVESEPGKGATFTLVIPAEPILPPVREMHTTQAQDQR